MNQLSLGIIASSVFAAEQLKRLHCCVALFYNLQQIFCLVLPFLFHSISHHHHTINSCCIQFRHIVMNRLVVVNEKMMDFSATTPVFRPNDQITLQHPVDLNYVNL